MKKGDKVYVIQADTDGDGEAMNINVAEREVFAISEERDYVYVVPGGWLFADHVYASEIDAKRALLGRINRIVTDLSDKRADLEAEVAGAELAIASGTDVAGEAA